MIDYVIYYASLGWRVFPVHSIGDDGKCTCHAGEACTQPGKHPCLGDGFKSATTEEMLLRQWWTIWPNANIGVATGPDSGLAVIDIDLGGEDSIDQQLPETVCQTTGSGGQHFLYKYPDDGKKYKSGSNLLHKVDSRAHGGYIIVAPSKHKSGGEYAWDLAPDEVEIADAPQWWLDMIEVKEQDMSLTARPVWNPDGELPENIFELLEAIKDDADHYESWMKVGMAIHYTDPSADGFAVYDWWSGLSAKYDAGSVRRQWAIFSRRGHSVGIPLTIDTVRGMAADRGYIDPMVEHGKSVADAIMMSAQMKVAEIISEIDHRVELAEPVEIFPRRGLLKDITDHIVDSAQYEQPELALGAAIALVAAVSGRKYTTETGATTCAYIMGIADTSMGKGHALDVANDIMYKIDALDMVSSEPASGSAIMSALADSPTKLYLMDEIGDYFGKIMSEKASPFQAEVKTMMLKLYGLAGEGKVIQGKDRADRKLNSTALIHSPTMIVYGATTGETFYRALNGGNMRDGLLSRLTIIDAGSRKPVAKERTRKSVPDHIIEKMKNIKNYNSVTGNLVGSLPTEMDIPTFHTVPFADGVKKEILSFTHYIDGMRGKGGSHDELYGRTAEQATRFALIYAISLDPYNPTIDMEAWEWGREFSLWATNTLINQTRENISDGEYDKLLKRILKAIMKAGKAGITNGVLGRITGTKPRERSEVINDLLEREEIMMVNEITTGRPRTVYYYTGGRN